MNATTAQLDQARRRITVHRDFERIEGGLASGPAVEGGAIRRNALRLHELRYVNT